MSTSRRRRSSSRLIRERDAIASGSAASPTMSRSRTPGRQPRMARATDPGPRDGASRLSAIRSSIDASRASRRASTVGCTHRRGLLAEAEYNGQESIARLHRGYIRRRETELAEKLASSRAARRPDRPRARRRRRARRSRPRAVRHLTQRVAWHDSRWNGRICAAPSANPYCIALEEIHKQRRRRLEDAHRRRSPGRELDRGK